MNIPRQMTRRRPAISSGKRLNNKPTYIVAAIVVMTLFGIYHAATSRVNNSHTNAEQTADQGDEMLLVDATPGTQIEFLQDRPDGLAGVNRNLFKEQRVEAGRESNLEDRLLDAYEAQQLQDLQNQNQMRETMVRRQIEQARLAYESDVNVAGFEPNSEFSRSRDKYRAASDQSGRGVQPQLQPSLRYQEIPASGRLPQVQSMPSTQIPTTIPTTLPLPQRTLQSQAAGQSALTSNQVAQLAANLPAELRPLLNAWAENVSAANTTAPTTAPATAANTNDTFPTVRGLEGEVRDFRLHRQLESPRTPFEVMTGSIIPAAMISAARSDLPGDIVAQVSHNVYDTATGRYLLIPQGTKLFGRYDAFTQLGQERLLIVWDRLVFPDAQTLDIGGMQGYDGRGRAGVTDKVNTHFVRTLFNALLISLVNASGDALVAAADQADNTFILNLSSGFGDTAGAPFDEYLRNRLRIRPTLSIRSGFRFNVMVSRDIAFDEPYRFGYQSGL